MSITTWTGSDGDNWESPTSWQPESVPGAGTIALIDTVTTGTVSEPYGDNTISFPVDGPVYPNQTFDNQVIALGGGPASAGAAIPSLDFVPLNTDYETDILPGVTIGEVGQLDAVNFLSVGVDSPYFEDAGLIYSDQAGGTLTLDAQSYSLVTGSLALSGEVAAGSGGVVDIAPPVADIVATDTLGDSDTLAPDFVTNSGLIIADPGGTILLDDGSAGFTNTGSIVAAGGTVLVETAVEEANSLVASSGSGSLYVAGGVVDVVNDSLFVGEYVTFQSDGTLILAAQDGSVAFVEGLLGFAPGDTLEMPGNTLSNLAYSGHVLSFDRTDDGQTYDGSETIDTTLASPTFLVTDDGAGVTIACFARGTHLLTDRGPAPVETLYRGTNMVTASGALRPIVWLGHRTIDCRRHPEPEKIFPVHIAADAFGPGLPSRPLDLSPDHAIQAEGVLIPVRHLINGATIVQRPVANIEYWHVELASHDILRAEGLPAESYLDTGNRAGFANGGSLARLHPDFAPAVEAHLIWEAAACAPLCIAGPDFDRVADSVRRQAAALGHNVAPVTRRPGAHPAPVTDPAALLQPGWYRAANPDVAASGLDPAMHYAVRGRAEGRLPCPAADLLRGLGMVDAAMMAFGLEDLPAAGLDVADHYCAAGWQEGRRLNPYFDPDFYGAPPAHNPLLHYLLTGEGEGRAPCRHFDPAWYRRRYALAPGHSPLAHFLAHRRTWRVSPNRHFDLAAYVREARDTLRENRDPYAHFLTRRTPSVRQREPVRMRQGLRGHANDPALGRQPGR